MKKTPPRGLRHRPDRGYAGTMLRFLLQAVVTALGLWLASEIVPGVSVTNTGSLIAAAVLLGVVLFPQLSLWLPALLRS